jgi:hypothetical protein
MLRGRRIRVRSARVAAILACGFMLGTFAWPVEHPAPDGPPVVAMTVEPVPLDRADPARRRLGSLIFLGGWRLSSRDVRFGGISAMHVENGEILALSDGGGLFRFPVPRPGTMPLHIARVPHGPGSGARKGDRDGEAMAVAGDRAWIAWEGRNAVWRYRRDGFAVQATAAPERMEGWQTQRGPEAMARLPNGDFLVFAEGPEAADGSTPALLFRGDPADARTAAEPLRYRPPPGYRPTDAAALADGRVIVLNRRFRALGGFSAIVSVTRLPRTHGPGPMESAEIAVFAGSIMRDNYEALSVTCEGGRTIVWIASDDNYTPVLQWTLVMKFALAE